MSSNPTPFVDVVYANPGSAHTCPPSRSCSPPLVCGASQYGRVGLALSRRICRGLTIAGVEGRKARAAFDL